MTRPALVFLSILLSNDARAEEKWIRASSPNFELHTTASEKRARETILRFEQVQSFFVKATGSKPPTKRQVRVVAFQSEKEYRPYQMNEGTAGHAGGDREHDEIVLRGGTPDEYSVAVHEYVHILLKPLEHLPLWLNEGTAELYSTLAPTGKKVKVGNFPPGRYIELKQSKWLDLATLLAVTHDSPIYNGKDHRGVFYAQSWALVHMLFLDPSYRDNFTPFMTKIVAGSSEADAFREVFGKQLAQVETDLHAYMANNSYFAAVFDVTLDKSAEQPEVRPATPLESGLALARILANMNRVDEARKAYEQLASTNSAEPQIPEALAYLEWRSDKRGQARAQFARAVELGSRNPRLYYDYAGIVDGDAGRGKTQAALLTKAVELDPEYREARLQLAYVLAAEEDYRGALTHLARFRKVEPKEAYRFFYSLAFVNYRLGNKEEALNAANRATQYAEDSTGRNSVQELIAALTAAPPPRPEPTVAEAPTAPPTGFPEPDQRPNLKRRLLSVTGTLIHLDCLGDVARLRLRSATGAVNLLMKDPSSVTIEGTGSGTFTFDCGPQKPRAVTVAYEPASDSKLGTTGVVRAIEFRQ